MSPRIKLNLALGLLGGLIVGILIAIAVESVDDTLSSSEELETQIKLPVLCSIPMSNSGTRKAHESAPPVLIEDPQSQAAEAFRGLRSSLLLSSPDQPPKMIAVVSSLAGEGKTTVSANLGIAFAQRGESVLLIDGDLRRSSLHKHLGLAHSRFGVSTIVTQGMDTRALVTPIESLPNLKFLPAGPHPPNPAELLGSNRMIDMLEKLSGEYDRIIIDTPPVLAVADSLPIAHLADAVLIVVRSGVARRKAVARACDLLQRANSKLVGAVFNAVNLKLENYYYAQGAMYGKKMANYYLEQE